MGIKIGFDFETGKPIVESTEEEHEINEDEKEILEEIIKHLDGDERRFKICSPSSNYTTLKYKGVDLIRVKSTSRAEWIKIQISNIDNKNERDNPLFEMQTNKNEAMWKSSLENLDELYPFIERAKDMIDSWH